MRKERIAFFHELHAGGARRACDEFASALKKDYFVDLYYIDEKKDKKSSSLYDESIFFSFIPKQWSGGNWKVKLYKDTLELLRLYLLHKKIAKRINSKEYAYVFIHGSKYTQAPFLLRLIKHKTIYYCQEPLRIAYEAYFAIDRKLSLPKRTYEMAMRNIKKRIDKQNALAADILLANSTFTQKNIFHAFGREAIVCHMGVKTEIFYPEKKKKDIDILFIGSYDFIDGYSLLIDSLQKMNDTKVNTKYITRETEWITDDGVLRDYYNRSKCVIAFGYKEPFGLIPLEAMSCSTPVIALNEGGYKDSVISGKTGFLVERDPVQIAERISYLIKHPSVVSSMGKNAREWILSAWTKRVKELNELLAVDTE
jgi:glycosyltransferase involved in cell wall biosynthesis